MLITYYNFSTADIDLATQQAIFELSEIQNTNCFKLDKKFKFMHAMFENFIASNEFSLL